ncbi:NAD(P)/FAD-dependent oxidoreductase [Acidocella aminolytica]|uniref:Sulfide-quinone reductase n=1 Tax=Acidocella aminolytica 101 = DSM 11237 TaxID=1120923 RepID=A0A0D6PI48_9PROT|nr:FAD/NAD(P)-binding oxidoreductase [Acidocella aminolytica]GAN80878.1 sulfide-quinone oxidoreductase [Acidocella aminolytica 101 = DSM 11237]GBQ34396.1 putative NAD/FAD-dependent oxidoreductase [Acidocella aminolytica 101 = DSM 11237]SHE31059.1 sulfide-quinone oxidoreductase [Acidocella aminolytica 101 = DSM 11237]
MSEVVILGAGLGGTLMAYEMRAKARQEDRITLISASAVYQFYPSNPWVAVGWRRRREIEVDLTSVMERKKIRFVTESARRVHPAENQVELQSGERVGYDYLIIATGPELAFDEIPGLGPAGYTQSICETGDAELAYGAFERFCDNPGPVVIGAAQGASCFGPAYELAFILDSELKKRKLRHKVPMVFVTPEPYVGHLGLDGVGDTKGLLEAELRDRYIKWITNVRVKEVSDGRMVVEELNEDASLKAAHDLPFAFSMIMPPFRGVKAVFGIEGLTNTRGFILADEYQRNPTYQNIFSIGVCVAIPPVGQTPVPVGVPKTGFMIESMVTATAHNLGALLRGGEVSQRPTWNAVCLADFGDGGVAFVAQPELPPRDMNWAMQGKWVHYAKIGFEKYFLRKIKAGESESPYEHYLLKALGIHKLKGEE